MKSQDLDVFYTQDFVRLVATSAGQHAAEFQSEARIVEKKRKDFVTEADHASEELIMHYLQREFPGIPFLSEEAGGEQLTEGLIFVINPIDGTVNYFHQNPYWGFRWL